MRQQYLAPYRRLTLRISVTCALSRSNSPGSGASRSSSSIWNRRYSMRVQAFQKGSLFRRPSEGDTKYTMHTNSRAEGGISSSLIDSTPDCAFVHHTPVPTNSSMQFHASVPDRHQTKHHSTRTSVGAGRISKTPIDADNFTMPLARPHQCSVRIGSGV